MNNIENNLFDELHLPIEINEKNDFFHNVILHKASINALLTNVFYLIVYLSICGLSTLVAYSFLSSFYALLTSVFIGVIFSKLIRKSIFNFINLKEMQQEKEIFNKKSEYNLFVWYVNSVNNKIIKLGDYKQENISLFKMEFNKYFSGFLVDLKESELESFIIKFIEVNNSKNDTVKNVFSNYLIEEMNINKKLNYELFESFYNNKVKDKLVLIEKDFNKIKEIEQVVNDDFWNFEKNEILNIIPNDKKEFIKKSLTDFKLQETEIDLNKLLSFKNEINKFNNVNNLLLNVSKKVNYKGDDKEVDILNELIETKLEDRNNEDFVKKIHHLNLI